MEIKQSLPVGVIYLIIELVLSFFIASIVKLLEPNIPIFQILFYRYLLSLPLLMIYGFAKYGLKIVKVNNIRLLLLRIVCGFLGLAMWFLAVAKIDISLATVLLNTMPLFITILSVIIARERVGWRAAVGMLVAFAGVFLLVGEPQTASAQFSAGLIVVGAFLWAVSAIQVKRLGVFDPFAFPDSNSLKTNSLFVFKLPDITTSPPKTDVPFVDVPIELTDPDT